MTKKAKLLSATALSLALISMPAAAADIAMGEAAGEITWTPDKAFGTAQLAIAGPDGYHVSRDFADGETPSFALFSDFGDAPDGSYTWNLTVTSKIADSLREDMEAARNAGDVDFMRALKAQGAFDSRSYSGHFLVVGGQAIVPELSTEVEAVDSDVAASAKAALPTKDQVISDDLIVDGSACVGTDCASGESFGFDTIRLKENNVRIKFLDTSNASGSFPSVDWQLIANDSDNGGANKFVIQDVTNNKDSFVIEANVRNNSLYLNDNGFVGMGTSAPVMNLHIKDGDSPGLRLEQDGSSGFNSYTWDIAGNEANFFIRDVSTSGTLPFRIEDGADQNSLYIDDSKNIGLNTDNPSAQLHVKNSDGDTQILVQEQSGTDAQRVLLKLENNGFPSFQMEDTSSGEAWVFSVKNDSFEVSKSGSGAQEFKVDGSGNLTITGSLTTGGGSYADYVFKDGYELLTLDEVEAFIDANGHLPNVKSEAEVEYGHKIDISELSVKLLEKVEELTLYTIDQHKTIRGQNELIQQLEERLTALEAQR